MKHYIELEKAVNRLLILAGWRYGEDEKPDKQILKQELEQLVELDVVEIIRCKHCNNTYEVENELFCNHLSGLCGLNVIVNNNDFCSYGERKNDD